MRSLYRILDANYNRAREALRTVEDFFRFSYTHPTLFLKIKTLRHKFSDAFIESFPLVDRILSRDSQNDIGRPEKIKEHLEYKTETDIVIANLNRYSEAVRCIEEISRLTNKNSVRTFSRLRFEGYSIQKEIYEFFALKRKLFESRLYVLLDPEYCNKDIISTTKEVIDNGADIVQLRDKKSSDRKIVQLGKVIRKLTSERGVLFIVNDKIDVALIVEADGVHLGRGDIPIKDARRILGSSKIIGATSHNLKELREAKKNGADYSSFGPFFETPIKPHLKTIKPELIKPQIKALDFPIFAIGGINLENIKAVLKTGINRVCICRGIISTQAPAKITHRIKNLLIKNSLRR